MTMQWQHPKLFHMNIINSKAPFTVVCGCSEGSDLLRPGAVPRSDLHQDRVVVKEARVLQARTVVVQQRHRVLVLEVDIIHLMVGFKNDSNHHVRQGVLSLDEYGSGQQR